MREQLIAYIDRLFSGTEESRAAQEFHDELLQNTLERFDEEVQNGKSDEDAYRTTILSLGNTDELIRPFYPKRENTGLLRGIAIALFCASFVPIILFGAIDGRLAVLGVALMFLMIAAATTILILSARAKTVKPAKDARTLRAFGVGMIIGSLAALMLGILYENFRGARLIPVSGAIIGLCGMFIMIAIGIAMLVAAGQKTHAHTAPEIPVSNGTQRGSAAAEEPKAENTVSTAPVMKPVVPKWVRIVGGILTAVYWIIVSMLFVSFLFTMKEWYYYSWLIFIVAGGVYDIIKSIVLMCCGLPRLEGILEGILALLAVAAYCWVLDRTGNILISILVFPISGFLGGITDGVIQLIRASKMEVQ